MTTEMLVKPATIYEQVLGKISEMKQQNLRAKQQEYIDHYKSEINYSFTCLVYKYFGITRNEACQLSDDELEALFTIVFERARKTALYIRILCFALIGWVSIENLSESWRLVVSVRELKRMLGNNFNPLTILSYKT